ncbi:hypothetical protein ACFQ3Z_33980 [Streptomyces nogalater]
MLIEICAAVALLLFVIGVIVDARRFANAVLLGVFLILMAVAHGRSSWPFTTPWTTPGW